MTTPFFPPPPGGPLEPPPPAPPPARRGLYVEDADRRPPSLLEMRRPNPLALLGGCITVVLVPSCVGLGGVLLALFAAAHMADPEEARAAVEEEPPPQIEFIPTKLVKLGRQFDARELPNRLRRARSTAPEQLARVPDRSHRRVRRPDAGVAPSDAVEDLLARIGTSADRQAALARAAEQEGDPDGVPEGTATREEGDVYRTRLYAFFRRGLRRPAELTDGEIQGLRATIAVTASAEGRIESFQVRSSGNEVFDHAVRQRMNQAVGSFLPEPPDDVRDQYFGRTFNVGVVPPR